MKKLCTALTSLAFLLSGCSGITTDDYAANTPKLDIREYLNGPLEAWGILYDMSGKADKRFHVAMVGAWRGSEGSLQEDFTYSDGKKDQRIWHIHMIDDYNFIATAPDVEGEAKGSQNGNTINLKYTLNAKRDNGDTIALSMDDWMYLMDDHVLINRTKMKKFGLTVGELVITFKKP